MSYIPSHVQIETVNRFCDARCPMCTIKFVPEHKKVTKDEFSNNGMSRAAEIMTLETFKAIVIKFKPYVERIRFLSLHGCGEPLLDKNLAEKVKYAKGDICAYPGKLKLILSGFHEGALAARGCFKYARPNEKLKFEFTTTSKNVHTRLGVKKND